MTGFGRSEILKNNRKIVIEVKSVNHRYLEAGIKMPKKLNSFESRIRETLKKYANRGKVDIFINYEDNNETQVNLKYNDKLAKEYMDIFAKMADEFKIENDINVSALSRYPEVISMEDAEVDEEELWAFIEEALKESLEKFVETRVLEGEHLKNDLLLKLDHMEKLVDFIEERSPEIMKEYRSKLEDKVKEILGDTTIDESRIATEVVIYADKICVDEETVRLRSHINHARKCLSEDGGIGRKMDFIAQEMNRESNTILSKANDIEISNAAIDLKTEIEKVREQIQNIE
jgi:uncharacterized protein (TIGR00255 family)